MICAGFLDSESRRDLIELARDGSAACRATIKTRTRDNQDEKAF